MITNKQVLEQGELLEHYPIDHNPFTGEKESNGGVENLIIFDHKIYCVLTDFTGSVADPTGQPDIVTDDVQSFMDTMFVFDDTEEVLKSQVEAQDEVDCEQLEFAHGIQEDFLRDDEW
jgi:hypothetical protein